MVPEDRDIEALIARGREGQERAPERSLVLFQRAVAMAARVGNAAAEADAEVGVGDAVYLLPGRSHESIGHYRRAIDLAPGSITAGIAWHQIGGVHRSLDHPEAAHAAYSRAIGLLAALGDGNGEWQARRSMAALLMLQDRHAEAAPHLLRGSDLALQDGATADAADLALVAGRVLLRIGRPSEAMVLLALAIELFEELGDDEQAHAGRQLHLLAVACMPAEQPAMESAEPSDDDPMALNDKAVDLVRRYERTGTPGLLGDAIALWRSALTALPSGRAGDRAIVLSGLGGGLTLRFEQRGGALYLDDAVDCLKMAVGLMASGDAGERRSAFNNLGIALAKRYRSRGEPSDIDEALRAGRAATAPGCEQHPHSTTFLTNLANSLVLEFERTGRLALLDEAVSAGRRALALAGDGRAILLANLSACLRVAFEHLGNHEDINEAVSLARQAVAATETTDPNLAGRLDNLAQILQTRCERLAMLREASALIADADEAVKAARTAVECAAPTWMDRGRYLANLADALLVRVKVYSSWAPPAPSWRDAQLAMAVDAARDGVAEAPEGHPGRASFLNVLATALRARGEPRGCDEVVAVARQAVEATATDHRFLASHLGNLANALKDRHDRDGSPQDGAEAVRLWKQAASTSGGPTYPRISAARNWALFAASTGDAQGAVSGYQAAVELLPLAAWRGLERPAAQENLAIWAGIASDAAAWAIEAGMPERAVELLEYGRSVLWAQALHLRTDLDVLEKVAPDLATDLREIRRALEAGTAASYSGLLADRGDVANQAQAGPWWRRLAEQWDALVAQVRNISGFQDFLSPVPFAELRQAAAGGTVVVVNCGSFRCDALAVSAEGVRVIPCLN